MNIRNKLILFTNALLVIAVVVMGGMSFIVLQQTTTKSIDDLETLMYEQYDENIKHQVDIVVSQLEGVQKSVAQGLITDSEGKLIAANIIREAKYNGDIGYFWADDIEGNNIVLLGREDVEGTNRMGLVDTKGLMILERFVELAKTDGEGYVDYYFPKPNETESLRKRGFIKLYEPYQWIVGTGNYVDDIENSIALRRTEQERTLMASLSIFLVVALVFVVIGVVVATAVSNGLSKPIRKVTEYLEHLSQLKIVSMQGLSTYKNRKDEIGAMATGLIKLNDVLEETIVAMDETSRSLAMNSTKMIEISNLTNENSNNVVSAVEEFAKGAQDQAEDAQEGNEGLKGLSDLILKSHHQTMDIYTLTDDVNTRQEDGRVAISKLVKDFETTYDLITELSKNIEELNLNAKSINEIVSVIEGIADETNLLALNASIEAARAGEAGKGFAVVAHEIRNLAEQTTNSTKRINSIVATVSKTVSYSKTNMDKSSAAMAHSFEMMQEVHGSFTGIIDLSQKSFSQIGEVRDKFEQINLSRERVMAAIEGISAVTEENAASAEEINATMETQKTTVNNLDQIASEVNQQIIKLKVLIDRFELQKN